MSWLMGYSFMVYGKVNVLVYGIYLSWFMETYMALFNEDLTLLVLLGRDSPGLMRMRLSWFYEDTTLLVL